jgi:cell division protein FtsA
MAVTPMVALEIGTSKVCALVGEAREDGNIMVTGLGQCPSLGVRKGLLVDLEKVEACVRSAIQGAEQSGAVEIRQVYLTLSGSQLKIREATRRDQG